MRRHLLALLIVINAASLVLFGSSGQAKDRTESGNQYFERNIKLSDDGTGKMPPWGPERLCALRKKQGGRFDTGCPMTQETFCALMNEEIRRGLRKSLDKTVCVSGAK